MKAERTTAAAFTVTFESEEELREEHRTNLSFGALPLPTAETVALDTLLLVTLRGPWGGEAFVQAKVVAVLPGGVALAFQGNADEIVERLMVKPATVEEEPEETPERQKSSWERIRGLSQMEKILLAVKADRSERALLLQDSDPRVLLSLLRNPRLTMEEVVRLTKSTYLTFQLAEAIMKASNWMGNLDVRLGLIHNPKTPPPFALRILPTIPDSEVRAIAKAGTNMALKQAAVRRLQGRG